MSMPQIPVDPHVRANNERLGERYLCHPKNRVARIAPCLDLTRHVRTLPALYVKRQGNVIIMSSERAA